MKKTGVHASNLTCSKADSALILKKPPTDFSVERICDQRGWIKVLINFRVSTNPRSALFRSNFYWVHEHWFHLDQFYRSASWPWTVSWSNEPRTRVYKHKSKKESGRLEKKTDETECELQRLNSAHTFVRERGNLCGCRKAIFPSTSGSDTKKSMMLRVRQGHLCWKMFFLLPNKYVHCTTGLHYAGQLVHNKSILHNTWVPSYILIYDWLSFVRTKVRR